MFAPRLTLHDPQDAHHILMPHDHDPLSSHQHPTARYTYTNSPLPSALRPHPHLSSSSLSSTTSLSASSQAKRRHVCSTCDRSFTTSGHLARHARVHTGERNHKCPFPGCETRCSRQDNLQQHYRIHLSPGSRRNSGPATRAAMTEALSSSDRSTSRRQNSQRRGGNGIASSPPSPSLSPIEPPALGQARQNQDSLLCERSATPEAPDTPPPLAPALPRCYRPLESTSSTSSRSSTSSTPEAVYHSSHPYSNMHRQAETLPASDVNSQRSPELMYPPPQITYASPMSGGHGHAAWGYGSEGIPQNHLEAQERLCHSSAGSKASTPPSPAESVGSQHSSHTSDMPNEAYSYPAPLELQYPDSSPAVQSHLNADRANVQYVHSTTVLSPQPHMHFRSAGSMQLSRHSIAHISPPRPQASPLSPDTITSFPSHPLTPVYAPVTTMTTSRLHETGSTSTSPHISPTTERRFADNMPIEVPQSHQLVYEEYSDSNSHTSVHAHGRSMSGSLHSEYPGSATAPNFGRGYLHSQSLPSHHGTHGASVRTTNSSPLTLAPIDDVRGDRNGEDLDVRHSAHSQSQGTSRPFSSHQSHHHGPAQVYPDLPSHIASAFTECGHSEADRAHNLTVHQPRPQRAIPDHQQYLNYYGSSFSVPTDVGWSTPDVGGRGHPAQ